MAHELGQVAGVVDVRVGEDHRVELRRIEREIAVLLERLLAVTLVESAIQQNALAVRLHEMHRTRGRLRRTVERDLHCASPLASFKFQVSS